TPVGLACPGRDEGGCAREIVSAADDVQVEAGDPELLLAREVEVAELGDGRDVAKDPDEIELALRGQRRPETLAKSEAARAHLAGVGIVGGGAGRPPYTAPR